jgi:RNA polymerase sigma-70 factor (ECF subfamily)
LPTSPVIAPLESSDKELLDLFAHAGSRELAFTRLVRRDQKKIYWFIRRMVIDHDDANDLVQDVFIKVWNGLPSFRAESSILHWIYRIAMNVTLTFLERRRKKHSSISLDDVPGELMAKLHSSKYISADRIQMRLQEAILLLPPRQRMVFHMRYYEEMPYTEMSAILETSEGALKASYHHAVKKVEEYLKQDA